MKTLTRYIPTGYTEYKPDLGDYPKDMFAAYVQKFEKHVSAIFYTGKQSKATWHYRFATMEEAGKKINSTISNLMSHADAKVKRATDKKAARAAMDVSHIKVGNIYHWSGGYNCTKNAYVKILGAAGKNKFSACHLSKYQVSGDWMNGSVAPIIDSHGDVIVLSARPGYGNDSVILRDTSHGYRDNYYSWKGTPDWENCD